MYLAMRDGYNGETMCLCGLCLGSLLQPDRTSLLVKQSDDVIETCCLCLMRFHSSCFVCTYAHAWKVSPYLCIFIRRERWSACILTPLCFLFIHSQLLASPLSTSYDLDNPLSRRKVPRVTYSSSSKIDRSISNTLSRCVLVP